MINTITQLGAKYKVQNPYTTGYPKLLKAIYTECKKDTKYAWTNYLDFSKVTILPQYQKPLKETEEELPNLHFDSELHLGKSPSEIRERSDLIVATMAQFLDQYLQGDKVLRSMSYQVIDFAFEDCSGRVPYGYFDRGDAQANLGGLNPDCRFDHCGVRSAVRGGFEPLPLLNLEQVPYSLPLTLIINGYEYTRKEL